jgi:hypothetical protein
MEDITCGIARAPEFLGRQPSVSMSMRLITRPAGPEFRTRAPYLSEQVS